MIDRSLVRWTEKSWARSHQQDLTYIRMWSFTVYWTIDISQSRFLESMVWPGLSPWLADQLINWQDNCSGGCSRLPTSWSPCYHLFLYLTVNTKEVWTVWIKTPATGLQIVHWNKNSPEILKLKRKLLTLYNWNINHWNNPWYMTIIVPPHISCLWWTANMHKAWSWYRCICLTSNSCEDISNL